MTKNRLNNSDFIRARLTGLAERGIVTAFREVATGKNNTHFIFRWLLNGEFVLVFNPTKQQLCLHNLLPRIPYRSLLDSDLRQFIREKAQPGSHAVRPVNSELVKLCYRNRQQSVSLLISARHGDMNDALTALLKVTNDLFAFLGLYYVDYLYQCFDLPQE